MAWRHELILQDKGLKKVKKKPADRMGQIKIVKPRPSK